MHVVAVGRYIVKQNPGFLVFPLYLRRAQQAEIISIYLDIFPQSIINIVLDRAFPTDINEGKPLFCKIHLEVRQVGQKILPLFGSNLLVPAYKL